MKQALRIITRMKGYTALSLLGLIISLSGTVIISRYLYQEWTIDGSCPRWTGLSSAACSTQVTPTG